MNRQITVGEIAELADVGPSAVSNWRSRHGDFPLPVEETSTGDLFDMSEVITWLESHGKSFTVPERQWVHTLWEGLDALRDQLRPEDSVLLFLQTMMVRHAEERGWIRNRWQDLTGAETGRVLGVWERCTTELSRDDSDLFRVLDPPEHATGDDVARAVAVVEQLAESGADWGVLATDLLKRLHDTLGARGEAGTPESVARLQVELLRPIIGSVYDPACGSAMVLARAWRRRESDNVDLCGQEVNVQSWRLGFLHLTLNRARFALTTGDTLRDDRFWELKADRIAADPPFGGRRTNSEGLSDSRWKFGIPGKFTDWLWPQVLLNHLAPEGRGVTTVPAGALFRGGREGSVRQAIVQEGLLDAVIELPPGLWARTSVPSALLVFDDARENRGDRVLFVDGRQLGTPRRGKPHELDENDIARVRDIVERWRGGELVDDPRFAAGANFDEILAREAVLSPNRYVQYATRVTAIDDTSIPERLEQLRGETENLAADLHRSTSTVLGILESISASSFGDFEGVPIGNLLVKEPQTGTRQALDGNDPEIPYIETGTVSGGVGRLLEVPESTTKGDPRGRLASRGDVLLVSRRIDPEKPIGCATVEFDDHAAYSESLMRLTPDPAGLDPHYLMLFLTSRQGRMALAAATTGSVIANLRTDALKEIEIPLPAMALQKRIADVVQGLMDGLATFADFQKVLGLTFDTAREGIVSGILAPEQNRDEQ